MFSRIERLAQDLRYATRVLARTPSFTVTAIASLAMGIAVNTTMFSVVSSLLLRPLGSGNDLVRIGRSGPDERAFRSTAYVDFTYLREHASSFVHITGDHLTALALGVADAAQPVSAQLVAPGYFRTVDVPLAVGRDFAVDEQRMPGDVAVAIVSDRLRKRLALDAPVAGRAISLNGIAFTVIGVAPARFHGTFPGVAVDVWLPAGLAWVADPRRDRRTDTSLQLIGRLRAGVSLAAAEAELAVLAKRLVEIEPNEGRQRRFVLAPARGAHPLIANVLRPFLSMLMAVVAVVLLIACVNVAGLLLARARARRGEVALRLAIGARRAQVVRQLLVESLLLGVSGAVAGLTLSLWPLRLLNHLSFIAGPTGAGIYLDLKLDVRVLLFTAAMSIVTALMFGLVPALQATRTAVSPALQNPRAIGDHTRFRLGGALVVVQVCVSFVLLVGATLLFRSLQNIDDVNVGFDPDHVVVATVDLDRLGYDRVRAARFYVDLLAQSRALAGIERAALANFVAIGEGRGHPLPLNIPGVAASRDEPTPTVAVGLVSDGYFAAVSQPLIRGRDFTGTDSTKTLAVAIVNEALARRYWPSSDALGQRIGLGAGDEYAERAIIGIVGNARFSSFGGAIEPFVFLPSFQERTLHLRTTANASDVVRSVRRIVQDIDPNAVPFVTVRAMREHMATSMSLIPAKIARAVLSVAGVVALLLAAGGLYGFVSFRVAQRMREVGIRVALGASRATVFRVVVGGAFRLTVVGLVIGITIAAGVMRLLSSVLYGLSPIDPPAFAAIAVLMALVTLAAGYGGAVRVIKLDPMIILRYD